MLYSWKHSDPVLPARSEMGMVRAEKNLWGTTPLETRVADLRGLTARALWACATLTTFPEAQFAAEGEFKVPDFELAQYRHDWGQGAVGILLSPFTVFAKLPTSRAPSPQFETYAGSEPVAVAGPDVGALQAVWLLYLLGSAAYTAVTCYTVHEASEIIDRHLSRRADLQKMTASLATAVRGVEIHNERELANGGQPLPLNDAEAKLLADLGMVTKDLANKTDPPRGGEGFFAGLGLTGLAFGAAALYLLTKGGQK